MGDFWAQVGASTLEFIFLAAVITGAVLLGCKLRMMKNIKEGKE